MGTLENVEWSWGEGWIESVCDGMTRTRSFFGRQRIQSGGECD
jgi:hypothetical protein